MKTTWLTLLSLIVLSFFSCDSSDNEIDMDKMLDYYFIHSNGYILYDSQENIRDSVIYSFVTTDSLMAVIHYFHEINGEIQTRIDTTYRKCYFNENKIEFTNFDWQLIYTSDYLLDFKWEVVSLNSSQLKLKLHSNIAPTGSISLACVSK